MDKAIWGEPIVIDSEAGAIAASEHTPDNGEEAVESVVVMLHGLGGNRHEHNGIFTRMAARLASQGRAAVRFDFLGNGESARDSEFMTLESMKADTMNVLSFVENKYGDKPKYILGLSLGGLVAAVIASLREDLSGAVLWEPPFHLITTLRRLYGPMALDRVRVRGYLQAGLLKLSQSFVEQYEALDATKIASVIPGPVLLIQGDQDMVVTMEDARLWQNAFSGNSAFKLSVVEGADHAFSSEAHALEVIELTAEFLDGLK